MHIPAKVIALALIILTVVIALIGYIQRSPVIHIALVAFPFLFLMMNNPSAWFVAIMGLERSGLVFPGLPQGLQFVHVMMAGFVALIIARNIIIKPKTGKMVLSEYFVYAFLIIIGITIYFRGFGLRALGGESWGGMGYVQLFIAAGFYLTAKYIQLTPRQIKLSIVLMLLLSFVPAISQIVFVASGGRIYQQYMFVHAYVVGLLSSLEAAETGRGVVRYQLLSGVAINLLLVGLVLIPFRGAYRLLAILFVIAAFVSSALSGFRGNIMLVIGMMALFIFFISEGKRVRRLVQMGGVAMAAFVVLFFVADRLPMSAQRSITWVPFIETAPSARMDAEGTSQWRLDVWRLAWQDVPRYLWIGKGYALNPAELMSHSVRRDGVQMAVATQDYHNGPLSLLLVFGIPGLIVGSGFLIVSSIEVVRRIPTLGDDPFIRRFYIAFLARYLFSAVTFFTIFGDARESFVRAFIMLAFMNMAYRVQRPVVKEQVDAETTPRSPQLRRPEWAPAISFSQSARPSPSK